MKRCPKCNRTFPDENQKFCTVDGGLLIASQPAFDPNATIRATSADLGMHSSEKATSRELPDPGGFGAAPTEMFPRNTARTGIPTSADLPVAQPAVTPPPLPIEVPAATPASPPKVTPTGPVKKKSKLPWILTALGLLLLIGAGGAAGLFFFVIKPRLGEFGERPVVTTPPVENTNTNTAVTESTPTPEPSPAEDAFEPPPNAVKFENSRANAEGKLAEHYFDFSFYYPQSWRRVERAQGSTNFVIVEKVLPPDFTQENFAVGWYNSKGSFEADRDSFQSHVEELNREFSRAFPNYKKVSDGPTKVNASDAYQFSFQGRSEGTEKGDIDIWGRVVFLPPNSPEEKTGATLVMWTTSLAPGQSGVDDVGVKGEMPLLLESFRFVKK